jgi:uncharacterized repeat protein (TIGR03803 family)
MALLREGGAYSGTVFELNPSSNGGWTKTILYNFGSVNNDGTQPQGVIFDKSGNLYGTTLRGGNSLCDHEQSASCGTVFELSPNGSGGWTETIIFSFPNGDSGGFWPNPGLIFDQSGNLYGTTSQGGAGFCFPSSGGCGIVFELSPNGGVGWTETLLYSFQGASDGAMPQAMVIFDQSGDLYGTALGGEGGSSTVLELSPNGSGGWTETTLYSFQGGSDGSYPFAGLIFDKAGNLYSRTAGGGGGANCGSLGCGTVFELSPSGSGGWTETILYIFQGGNDGNYGNEPSSGVIFDQSGHLYGTTPAGGGTGCNGSGCGVAFEISRTSFAKLSPVSLAFGNETLGIGSTLVTTFTNIGNLPFNITSIQINGANSADFGQLLLTALQAAHRLCL